MAFSINCNNKGCGKQMDPVLDETTGEVICTACDASILNISLFTKRQLKSLGQIRKPAKGAFAIKCVGCKKDVMPMLNDKNTLACPECKALLTNISKPFELLIRQAIKTGPKDVI